MSVLKEWECTEHGYFESSHPICPAFNCESANVKQVFLTPPNIGSEDLKRFNKGIMKSAEMYGISNFRSARAGEAAYGNDGKGMLWGSEVKKALGVDMSQLVAAAATPMTIKKADGTVEKLDKSVMRELGAQGITGRTLPKPAELVGHRADKELNHGNTKRSG